MNIRAAKDDVWPDHSDFWVSIDADIRSQREDGPRCGQFVLQRGDLALQRSVAGLKAADLREFGPGCGQFVLQGGDLALQRSVARLEATDLVLQ